MTCNKVPYDDKESALTDIKLQKSQLIHFSKRLGKVKKSNKKLRTYHCQRCDKWHLTTLKPNKLSRRVVSRRATR